MSVQTVPYAQNPDAAVAGLFADVAPKRIDSVIVETAIAAGLVVVHGSTTRTEGAPPSAPTAAPTAIIATGGASAATAQTISGASLNGAVGQGRISPARNITLVLSSSTDWDATTAVVTGENEDGEIITESLSIPNNGNATVTGTIPFSRIISVLIPAQTGTGGTFTMGTGVILGSVDNIVHGISLYDASREPGVWPVDSVMPVAEQGAVWVSAENAVNPSLPVFVRFVATGDEVLGAVRSAADANDCGRLRKARWLDTTSGPGLTRLAINL